MDLSLFQMENGSSRFIGVANAIKLNDLTFADAVIRLLDGTDLQVKISLEDAARMRGCTA